MSMQVPSSPTVTVATGPSGADSSYSASSSRASATAATASATFCTNERAMSRPWLERRFWVTRADPNSANSWAMIRANRGVELTTIRAASSSGQ